MLSVAAAQTNTAVTNTTAGSCVPCTVSVSRRVRYLFKTGLWDHALSSEKTLRIPVAVAVNGVIKPEYRSRCGRLTAYRAFDVWVQPGEKVSLYLNSDAAPGQRQHPVFEVTPTTHDAFVVVSEKRGHLGNQDVPQPAGSHPGEDGRTMDEFHAVLSGDTWKKISQLYTAADAQAQIPSATPAEVKDAVLSIYDGRCHGPLHVRTPAGAELVVQFETSQNCADNITNFDLFRDGLPRVHPLSWVAVIEAALAAAVTHLSTSSAWRPMLGSMAHRSGLGLDVTYLDDIHLNRAQLRSAGTSAYVTQHEKDLFAEKLHEDGLVAEDTQTLSRLQRQLRSAPAEQRAALQAQVDDMSQRLLEDRQEEEDTSRAWDNERNSHEPEKVRSFRTSLLRCSCVSQVFDPWLMDGNTKDGKTPVPNEQKDGNEKLHKNHLHVTVAEAAH
jgi:hypothetical protein